MTALFLADSVEVVLIPLEGALFTEPALELFVALLLASLYLLATAK